MRQNSKLIKITNKVKNNNRDNDRCRFSNHQYKEQESVKENK